MAISWDGEQMLRRTALLVGAILASAALLCALAANASAKEQRGLFVAGAKSEEPAKQPRFEGEIYPTYLFGTSLGTGQKWGFQGTNLKCPVVDFSGKLSAVSSEIVLNPFYQFATCSFSSGGVLTILGNGCEDTLKLLNSGPPYVAEFGIKCPTGEPYKFVQNYGGGLLCTYAIPAQTALATVGLTNKGEGKKRGVEVAFNVSGVKRTITPSSPEVPSAANAGTHESGTFTGSMLLNGFDAK
jgi:F0F1-type ATP synthase membrane subunit c/vacuolar-type H+-ATPase subunit K